ncbi:MAG: TetR/AcrR family transcriptional regulator [Myxococcota bacterium]
MAHADGLSPRKRPRQQRSRATVDAIVEAAARVFAEGGYAGGSTNRIAEQAGVAIGSLYEYFPNKAAILVAVAERHLDRMTADVEEMLADPEAGAPSLQVWVARFVEAMLEVHERAPKLTHVLFSEAPHPPELHACVLQVEEKLAHRIETLLLQSQEVRIEDADTAAHLVVQTAEALTHRFAHQGIHDLPRDRFIAEVTTLLMGYLGATR